MRASVNSLVFTLVAGLLLGPFAAATAVAAEDAPELSFDGLHRVQDSELALVWATPEIDLGGYDKIGILEVEVAFKKNWRRDHRGVTTDDMERIKRNVATVFRSVFVEELEAGGYEIVDHIGEDVLVVRPAVLDLVVNAPDTRSSGRTRTWVTSAGAATVLVELYDSVTGAILARAIDRRQAGRYGSAGGASPVTNNADARRMIKIWAVALREALDSVRADDVDVAAEGPE